MLNLKKMLSTPAPVVRINPHLPVIVTWTQDGFRRESKQPNMDSARAFAIKVIGVDDRMNVFIYDRKTKEKRGKVGLFAGHPYWKFQGKLHTLSKDGKVQRDLFDY